MLPPHGGSTLQEHYTDISSRAPGGYELTLSDIAEYDLYNIASGAYSPVTGFMGREDFVSVCETMHLRDGTLWPIPIILDMTEAEADAIRPLGKTTITLKNTNGDPIGIMHVAEIYPFDKNLFNQSVYGTQDASHPGVQAVGAMGEYLVSGEIEAYEKERFETSIEQYFYSPRTLRSIFQERGWKRVVAFQTRNPPHRSHEYIQKCALEQGDALLIHPVIGRKKSGDFHDACILGAYEKLLEKYYQGDRTFLAVLPIIMRYAGPREAILHAIIRQNYGCSHMIVGRDHAGVGKFYSAYAAQEIFDTLEPHDLSIDILRYQDASYCTECGHLSTEKTCPHGKEKKVSISGTEVRERIRMGGDIPDTFMRQEVTEFLRSYEQPFYE